MDPDGIQVNLESQSVSSLGTHEDDDNVIELEELKVDGTSKMDSKGKRKRKLTSQVWMFFDKLIEKSVDGKQRKDIADIGQLLLNKDMSMRCTKFDPDKFRELVVAAIVMHDLPLSFVEYVGVRAFCSYLNPNATLVSRNTLKSDLLKMYKKEKDKLKCVLKEAPGRLCLTSDLWTSITTDGYIAVTVHFIDNDWVLQKKILNFSFMPPPHSGVALSEKVGLILESDWGIEKKIFCVTLDNASANDVFVSLLKKNLNLKKPFVCKGEFFHLRCRAHVLNLVVQEGLKEIDDSIHKVRESIKYVRGSQVRKQKFLECVKFLSLNAKKGLRQDVPTRWNSTYLMLESALFYRRAFNHLEISDSNYKNCPSQFEWDRVKKISSFLSVFYDITCVFSGIKYPTANLYFPSVFTAYMMLKEHMDSEDVYLKNMANLMMAKFEKYWSEFSMILAIAVILDPRYKLQFVNWAYEKMYGVDSPQFDNVSSKLHEIYDEYKVSPSPTPTSQSKDSDSNQEESSFKKGLFKQFDSFRSKDQTRTQKSQLDLYLEEASIDKEENLDILSYWKANQYRYPELAFMARDILSIPVSTVASESTFSTGGRVLDQY
ncbi:zinc finger BED domain-containing protein RICESLEEPER 2-like [Diospyros lotus]|uniref:zinc finger BED domain-containing protein RICESLEEPER 2-like n=1 Tax=Diospyros lotus TaxID=55363 RepID=UPI00224C884C|nr:zinc finger BED domain-containing protein RICESLEEPER 2-like [Diospyros lotus]